MGAFITSVSEDEARNQVIAEKIRQLAGQDRKLLVLSDRRQHCQDLFALCHEQIPCGLYLGSMKQADLKLSEERQVMFSTYAMCSEGFDLPSLSTLVMATPKSDVNQSCGRVLRMAPGKKHEPLIVDIRDGHAVFHAQFNKRRTWYKSQGFKIAGADQGEPRRTTSYACAFLED